MGCWKAMIHLHVLRDTKNKEGSLNDHKGLRGDQEVVMGSVIRFLFSMRPLCQDWEIWLFYPCLCKNQHREQRKMEKQKQMLQKKREQGKTPCCKWKGDKWLTCYILSSKVKRWITSLNQDSQEKYQQPQVCRWYHSNGRKWRGTKEPFDEGERGEWKSWLRTQLSINEDHGIRSHQFMAKRWEKSGNSGRFHFLGLQNQCGWLLRPQN